MKRYDHSQMNYFLLFSLSFVTNIQSLDKSKVNLLEDVTVVAKTFLRNMK